MGKGGLLQHPGLEAPTSESPKNSSPSPDLLLDGAGGWWSGVELVESLDELAAEPLSTAGLLPLGLAPQG